MHIDRLLNFYSQLKKIQPTLEDFRNAGYDNKTSINLYTNFDISLKKQANISRSNNLFESFFLTFNVNGFAPSNWSFTNNLLSKKEYVVFATYDIEQISLHKESQEIRFVDFYDNSNFKPLAPNFDVFLDVILVEVEYDKVGYLNQDFTDKMRFEYRNKLESILSQEKYLASYFPNIM